MTMAMRTSTLVFVAAFATAVGASVLPMERRCELLCDEAGGSSSQADSDGVCVCQVTQDVIDFDYQNLEAVKKKAWDLGLVFVHAPREGRYERCLDRILKLKAKNAENEEETLKKKWQRYEAKKHRHPHKIKKGKNDIEEKKYAFKGRTKEDEYKSEEEQYEKEAKEYVEEEKGYRKDEKEYGRNERQRAAAKEQEDPDRSRRDKSSSVTKRPLVVPRVVPRL